MSTEAMILGTIAALNACRGMTGTAQDHIRLDAINARTIRDASAAFYAYGGDDYAYGGDDLVNPDAEPHEFR